jgi:hypothetical protein
MTFRMTMATIPPRKRSQMPATTRSVESPQWLSSPPSETLVLALGRTARDEGEQPESDEDDAERSPSQFGEMLRQVAKQGRHRKHVLTMSPSAAFRQPGGGVSIHVRFLRTIALVSKGACR